jgi:hypothetical protein
LRIPRAGAAVPNWGCPPTKRVRRSPLSLVRRMRSISERSTLRYMDQLRLARAWATRSHNCRSARGLLKGHCRTLAWASGTAPERQICARPGFQNLRNGLSGCSASLAHLEPGTILPSQARVPRLRGWLTRCRPLTQRSTSGASLGRNRHRIRRDIASFGGEPSGSMLRIAPLSTDHAMFGGPRRHELTLRGA